jgi:hypothetical protein
VAVLAVCSEQLSVGKFPDHRENRGNFTEIDPIGLAGPPENQPIGGGIP